MIIRKFVYSILMFIPLACCAVELRPPMNIPIELAGNFAELRSNHFHSGIDFKTQQQVGQPIYSVYDGYVSRINVSSRGYGNCLYINHPAVGLTSVYAHLDGYEAKIDSVLKERQYQEKRFNVDFTLDPDVLPVKVGDLVAISGNTGSSGGPHLHFEVRDMNTEVALDPLDYYDVPDATKPRIHRIYITPMPGEGVVAGGASTKSYSTDQLKNNPVKVYGRVGISVRANDYMNGTGNIYGVKSLKVEVDGVVKFHYLNNGFSFDSTRYLNAFIDYSLWRANRTMVMKCYLPDNPCMQYIADQNDGGYLYVNESRPYKVKITVADHSGNQTVSNFTLVGDSTVIPIVNAYNGGKYVMWNMRNTIKDDKLFFELPRGSLYNNIYFKYKSQPDSTAYSDAFQLHYASEPLQKYCTLKIKLNVDTLVNKNQYYIAQSDNGISYQFACSTTYKDGYVEGNVRDLGWYKVMADKSNPAIKYLGKFGNTIKYRVSDTGSVIGDFTGTIDGEWADFYYDAKSYTIFYTFDPKRVEKGKNHKVELIVYDRCGNSSKHKTNVYW